eukprot:scaffold3340_cov63-Phaeocystis_antarctica.AAC.7
MRVWEAHGKELALKKTSGQIKLGGHAGESCGFAVKRKPRKPRLLANFARRTRNPERSQQSRHRGFLLRLSDPAAVTARSTVTHGDGGRVTVRRRPPCLGGIDSDAARYRLCGRVGRHERAEPVRIERHAAPAYAASGWRPLGACHAAGGGAGSHLPW